MTTTKALIYTRFSPRPSDQIDACVSTEVQAQACKEYAQRNGYEVEGVYSDEEVSRNSLMRPGLGAMMNKVRRGTVVLAYHPDRIGSGIPAAVLQHELSQKGARLEYSHSEFNGDSPEMEFLRSIMHAIAELNRATTALKTAQAMKFRQDQGERMTHPDRVPFGSKVDPENPARTIPDEHERSTLNTMLALHDSGMGVIRIGKELDRLGMPPRSGGEWNRGSVHRIIKREVDRRAKG